jgi:hypothetical protein
VSVVVGADDLDEAVERSRSKSCSMISLVSSSVSLPFAPSDLARRRN